ncbi:hypothetical protein BDN72DRAFT_779859, partial [Pluteus cervinus]
KIPNIILARWNTRHMLRIFFPQLGGPTTTRSPQLTPEEMGEFYDLVLRPAIMEVEPTHTHNWPASYFAEGFRARNHRHGFQNGTMAFPRSGVKSLSAAIVRLANETLPWGKNIVFGAQVRGVKLHNSHENDEQGPVDVLGDISQNLDVTTGSWWVDVGLEVMEAGRAILWRSDAHVKLMTAVLGISEDDALSLKRSRNHEKDISSHLTSVAGFRVKCREHPGEFEAAYLQAYTTDKGATYHREGRNVAKRITTGMAMEGTPPKFCTSLERTYEDCATKTDVAARLEVRVPLRYATSALANLPVRVLRECVLNMSRAVWWCVCLVFPWQT